MRALGKVGRFGNQVFQYAFIRAYARRYGLEYQVAPWVGQHLFGHRDPVVTAVLPRKRERHVDGRIHKPAIAPDGDEFRNHDFRGWAQYHTSYYRPDKYFIKGLFFPAAEAYDRVGAAAEGLRGMGKTRVGLHIRRGDTGRAIFYFTPTSWYKDWLAEHWGSLEDPVLFIATEDPALVAEFEEYEPRTADRLGVRLRAVPMPNYVYLENDTPHTDPVVADFFPDWYLLTQCDLLLIGNSTFGFAAAWVSPHVRQCWRSRLSLQAFEKIDPWDTTPLTYEHLRDYRNIPGTRARR